MLIRNSSIRKVSRKAQAERRSKLAVQVFSDGREVCLRNPAGRAEYHHRTELMWERQKGLCRWCGKFMPHPCGMYGIGSGSLSSPTFDHDVPRVYRDDRIEVMRDGVMVQQNAAVHFSCNSERGSQRELTREEAMTARKKVASHA